MIHKIYELITLLFAPFAPFYLVRRVKKGKEDPARLLERYGRPTHKRPKGKLIWFHAASVGEARSTLSLIQQLLQRNKDLSVLITTGTLTSARIMEQDLPKRAFHQFIPLDVKVWGERFLDHWKPNVAIWIEQELWPNIITSIHKRKIPILLANAHLTDSSYKRWRLLKRYARQLLLPFNLIYAKSEIDGRRYTGLLNKKVNVKGNLKYAASPLNYDQKKLEELQNQIGKRPLWLAVSTHEGEEEILTQAHQLLLQHIPDVLLIIVPRHPNRGPEIAKGLAKSFPALKVAQRSKNQKIDHHTSLYIADTLGEMGLFYQLSRIAFVGGSLVPIGGHNLIEPAQQGCLTLYGPHMHKTKEIKEDFESVQAGFSLHSPQEIAEQLQDLMENPTKIVKAVDRAHKLIYDKRKILDYLITDIELITK